MNSWTFQRIRKRTIEVLREEGIKSLWFKVLGETVYRRLMLMKHSLDNPRLNRARCLPVIITLLKKSEVDEYSHFRSEADPANVLRRLNAGDWCFTVRHKGEIINASWFAAERAWIEYLSLDIHLAEDEVYLYDIFTVLEYRGRNIAALSITEAMMYFQDVGYGRIVTAVLPENGPGFRTLEKTGFHPCGKIGYLKIGLWKHSIGKLKRK